jgi:hypothetical protein
MEALTPASPDSLPPLGDLIADEPSWRYPADAACAGVAYVHVWLTAEPEPGHLAGGHPDRHRLRDHRVYGAHLGRSRPQVRARACPARAPPGTGDRKAGDSRPGPRRCRRQPALDARVADSRRRIPAMPGSSCGWPSTGTGSSAGRRARSTDARTRAGHEPKVAWTSAASRIGT